MPTVKGGDSMKLGIKIAAIFTLLALSCTSVASATHEVSLALDPERCSSDAKAIFVLSVRNRSGDAIWDVRITLPTGFEIIGVLPPPGWGYAIQASVIIFQALEEAALIRENEAAEFELTLLTPELGRAAENPFQFTVLTKDVVGSTVSDNLLVAVDNLPPSVEIEVPGVLGLGVAPIEISASEPLREIAVLVVTDGEMEPLALTSENRTHFTASLRVVPGFEDFSPRLLVLAENTADLVGNGLGSNVVRELEVDTRPPVLENLRLDGKPLENGLRVLSVLPEISVRVYDTSSGVGNWKVRLLGPEGEIGMSAKPENDALLIAPQENLHAGSYEISITVSDRAEPPNTASISITFVVQRPFGLELLLIPALASVSFVVVLWLRRR
jgi:hypothetical protein